MFMQKPAACEQSRCVFEVLGFPVISLCSARNDYRIPASPPPETRSLARNPQIFNGGNHGLYFQKPLRTNGKRLKGCIRTAFPRAERKPFGLICRQARRGRMELLTLRGGESASWLGLAVAMLGHGDFALLDYFAVDPSARGWRHRQRSAQTASRTLRRQTLFSRNRAARSAGHSARAGKAASTAESLLSAQRYAGAGTVRLHPPAERTGPPTRRRSAGHGRTIPCRIPQRAPAHGSPPRRPAYPPADS